MWTELLPKGLLETVIPLDITSLIFLNKIGENTAKRTGINQNNVSKQLIITYKEAFSFY